MTVDISLQIDSEVRPDTLDVDLPAEWIGTDTVTTEELESMEEVLELFDDEYEETDYQLDELKIVDNDNTNKYKGRNDGTPIIEVTKHHFLPGTTIHEIGHDVEKYHLGRKFREEAYNELVSKTFSELFAHLNALHITEKLDKDYEDHFNWSLSREKYEECWEGLDDAIKSSNRQEEQEILYNIVLEDELEQIESYIDELLDIPPVTAEKDDNSNYGIQRQKNMFVDGLPMGSIGRGKQDLHALTKMLLTADERGESRATRHIRYAHKHEDEDPVHGTIVNATNDYLQNHEIFTAYNEHLEERDMEKKELEERSDDASDQIIASEGRDILEYAFDMTLEQLQNSVSEYKHTLEEEDRVELAYDAVSHEEYGYKRDGDPTDYDEYLDFPHNVGGTLALELHAEDTSPIDVLDEPDRYLAACEDAIRSGIYTRIA